MSRRRFPRFRGPEPESEQVAPLAPPLAPTTHHLALVAGSTGEISPYFPLQAERTTIGRNPECDVQLLDATVSRLHAEIVRSGDSYVLMPRSSVNCAKLWPEPTLRLVQGRAPSSKRRNVLPIG